MVEMDPTFRAMWQEYSNKKELIEEQEKTIEKLNKAVFVLQQSAFRNGDTDAIAEALEILDKNEESSKIEIVFQFNPNDYDDPVSPQVKLDIKLAIHTIPIDGEEYWGTFIGAKHITWKIREIDG